MKTKTRKRIHLVLAWFFAVQIPPAVWLAIAYPVLFNKWWKLYLVFLSLWALVAGHWSGMSADTPND